MKISDLDEVINRLRRAYLSFVEPVVTLVARDNDPYKVLISTVLSLRTKDATTLDASLRLFEKAPTIQKLAKLSEDEISNLIYPVGFYKTKAKNLKKIANILIEQYNAKVPDSMDELLKLPNVGRKTANLVLAKGYDMPAICVDIHVHRISNRFGLIKTKNPLETEMKLREILPKKYWIEYNDLLVPFGQNLCKPISPYCSKCHVYEFCDRVGVAKHR
jgi:endonuclease-3